ncbi:metallophosphoesterase [Ruminococcus sp. FC2018]|uniref:metallophosphoesterase n=1 Tax=Ruminococcus sp. FC2018 TaxID=1410617 RepID=UPI00048F53DD|nr:metallophosphoesterase [Ruminococcus sp. FC2018]
MKKGVYIMVFVIFAAVVFVLGIGVVSCLDWWKNNVAASKVYFWLIVTLLITNMFYTVFNIKSITFKPLKEVMIFLSAVTFIVLIYTSVIMLLKYVFGFLLGAFLKPENRFLHFIKETRITVPVLLIATALLGVVGYINAGIVRTSDHEINVQKASKNKSLTAAVVSDTHIGISAHKSTIDTIVEKINGMQPDVVFLLGDVFDENTTTDEMEYFSEKFKSVKSKYGSFYILGNHEGMQGGDTTEYFTQAGIRVLQDESAVIAEDITLVGMRSEYDTVGYSIDKLLERTKADKTKPLIVLKHEPHGIKEIAAAGADVSMHGHTHGEQFPLTYLPFSFMNDMMYGTQQFGDMTAFTTQGAGGWGFHFKFPAKCEVAKVTINFAEKK